MPNYGSGPGISGKNTPWENTPATGLTAPENPHIIGKEHFQRREIYEFLQRQLFQLLQQELSKGIASINVVAEQYPDLKANENFLNLNNQLQKNEEDIANARKYYNRSEEHTSELQSPR